MPPMNPFITLTRLDKPIGIWLLFFPAAWGVALAGGDARLMLLMLVGATVTRAAGCIVNDLTDRKLDAQVERTRHRPLMGAAGEFGHHTAPFGVYFLRGHHIAAHHAVHEHGGRGLVARAFDPEDHEWGRGRHG